MCEYINDTLQKAIDDGTWAKAFEATLGQSGVETPEPPTLDGPGRPDASSPPGSAT